MALALRCPVAAVADSAARLAAMLNAVGRSIEHGEIERSEVETIRMDVARLVGKIPGVVRLSAGRVTGTTVTTEAGVDDPSCVILSAIGM